MNSRIRSCRPWSGLLVTASRIALGTVQFGQAYGVANRSGQVSVEEAASILQIAWESGIDTLDTAATYGESEARLGEIGVADWNIVSKLPEMSADIKDVMSWAESTVAASLGRLGVDNLEGVLLHRPRQLEGDRGDELRAALVALRDSGVARRVGLSAYGPDDLDAAWNDELDLVQTPFNVVDRSLISSGWLDRLVAAGVTVHTRSAFLQGLLLMENRPAAFDAWSELLTEWDQWLRTHSTNPVAACLGFALAQSSIGRVVVGVDNAEQLQEILDLIEDPIPPVPDTLINADRDLIDPSRWTLE